MNHRCPGALEQVWDSSRHFSGQKVGQCIKERLYGMWTRRCRARVCRHQHQGRQLLGRARQGDSVKSMADCGRSTEGNKTCWDPFPEHPLAWSIIKKIALFNEKFKYSCRKKSPNIRKGCLGLVPLDVTIDSYIKKSPKQWGNRAKLTSGWWGTIGAICRWRSAARAAKS